MSEKDKNIISSPEDFLKYSANKMSPEERNAFERKLQKDAFEDEAAEGFTLISPEDARRDILNLSNLIRNRIRQRGNMVLYRIAASVAVLAIVSSVFFLVIKNRIDKGTGQMIISQSSSTQKEETKIEQPQKVSPEQPEVEMKALTDGAGRKGINKDQITEAKSAKKTEVYESPEGSLKKAKSIIEPSKQVSKEPPASVIRSLEANRETALQDKTGDNLPGHGLSTIQIRKETVEGIVFSSEDSTPLPGVNIMIKGTNQETTTNIHGKFSIPVLRDSSTILISQSAGMIQKETRLKDSSFVRIKMEPEVLAIEEVVPVGYAIQKKLNTTSSDLKEDLSKIKYSSPLPINGMNGFKDYIRRNAVFPVTNKNISRTVVILNFMVRTDGRPDSIIVVKSQGEEFSAEAIRLLKEGPPWIPAIKNGKKVVEATQVKIILTPSK